MRSSTATLMGAINMRCAATTQPNTGSLDFINATNSPTGDSSRALQYDNSNRRLRSETLMLDLAAMDLPVAANFCALPKTDTLGTAVAQGAPATKVDYPYEAKVKTDSFSPDYFS